MATIYGTNGADALRGTTSADAIYGFWGDDSVEGGVGRDFLYGGNGNDTLDGGAGQDVIDGEGGFDLVLYASNATPVWADLRTGAVSFPGQSWPTETLANVEAIDGGGGADRFIGNGAGNRFWGSAGNDTLVGNVGSDTLLGGAGADSLDGGNGQDSLVGSFGNDTMRGGLHDDLFTIGPIVRLDDPFTLAFGEFGADVIEGGGGTDTLSIDGPTLWVQDPESSPDHGDDKGAPAVRANLGLGTLRIGDSENRSTLISIENVETGSGDDSINGSTSDNFIRAGDGANVVYAGGGNDTMFGGFWTYPEKGSSTVEILNGGGGDDVIYGNGSMAIESYGPGSSTSTGADVLVGGSGDDTIYGGAAFQTINGEAGKDLIVLSDEPSGDDYQGNGSTYYADTTITDFADEDTIRFNFTRTTGPVEFVGEVASEDDLGRFEIGYTQDDEGTTLLAHLEEGVMHVFLPGYFEDLTDDVLGLS